jgi:hypothetical protein
MAPRLLPALGAALLALAFATVPAHAATTVGSPLSGGVFGTSFNPCSATCTYLQYSGGALSHTSPVHGVVVRWRVLAASAGSPVRLRILRPGGGGFAGAGSSAQQSTTGGSLDTFETRLPIWAGDAVGLDTVAAARVFAQAPASMDVRLIQPAPADGASGMPGGPLSSRDLQVNVDVEPDADGDGFGDETQDGCPGSGALQSPCGSRVSDRVRPTISGLLLTRTLVTWRLSEAGRTTLLLERLSRRGPRRRASLTVAGRRGVNRLSLARLLRGARLAAGAYRLTLIVRDPAGNVAVPRRAQLRVAGRR